MKEKFIIEIANTGEYLVVLYSLEKMFNFEFNSNLDLGEKGYMYALDSEGIELVHPKSESQNLWESEDSNGIKFVQEIIKRWRCLL